MICKLTPPGNMSTYFLDDKNLENVAIAEMLPTYIGWQNVFISDEVLRGYTGELQDFTECVLCGRKPESDFDLACETIKTVYGAYLSAEEGRTISLKDL
jgi:predicted dehydrogenase